MNRTPIRVLMYPTVSDADWDNPYMRLLVDALAQQGVQVTAFTWARALRGRYEVLHINWPEFLVTSRGVGPALRFALVVLIVAILKARRVPIVVTVHNLRPHTATPLSGLVSRFVYRFATERIYLQRWSQQERSVGPGTYIPHGSYADYLRSSGEVTAEETGSDLLLFGQLRPNKGIERLLLTMGSLRGTTGLHIAGAPVPATFGAGLADLAASPGIGDRTRLTLRRLSSEELHAFVRSCRAVVLPYDDLYNSGALILALSAGRPVIATTSRSTKEIAADLGPGAVQLLPEGWRAVELEEAMLALTLPPPSLGPDYEWSKIAARLVELYRSLRGTC